MQISSSFGFKIKLTLMRKFFHTLDKEEKRYDKFSSIGYRCIYKMSASKVKKKVGYITHKFSETLIMKISGVWNVLGSS